jgi:hypothetical protein
MCAQNYLIIHLASPDGARHAPESRNKAAIEREKSVVSSYRSERGVIPVLALSALLVGGIGAAHAEGIAPAGPIDSDFTWTERQQTMPTAGGLQAYTAEDMLVVTATSPGSGLDKLAGRCLVLGEQSTDGSQFTEHGVCTLADIDGDHIFETVDLSNGIGRSKLTGGTGKFQGITGELELTSSYFGSPADGVSQGIGHKKGSYKIVK